VSVVTKRDFAAHLALQLLKGYSQDLTSLGPVCAKRAADAADAIEKERPGFFDAEAVDYRPCDA